MAKSRSFSIFLLKKGFDSSNSLKKDHNLGAPVVAENLPEDAIMYVYNSPSMKPWWIDYWKIKDESIRYSYNGALIFYPIERRWFVISFGYTYHKLKENCFEYDFGLKTTLNAVNPEKLKSTDIINPENAKQERIQSPIPSDLTFFDINNDESIFKRLTGIVKKEYKEYFSNISGADNIKVNTNYEASKFNVFCIKLLEIYKKNSYKRSFPNIHNIVPVKSEKSIENLNKKFINAFNQENSDIMLSIPQIVNYDSEIFFKFSGAGKSQKYEDINIMHYKSYLKERKIEEVTNDMLIRHKLIIINESDETIHEFSIFKCSLFDCKYYQKHYHLCDGKWYNIDKNYIKKIKSTIEKYFVQYELLCDCDVKKESEYNEIVANSCDNALCLDRKNISPSGNTQVEPCDIFYLKEDFVHLIHVKIWSKSASISHLFNQGYNSIELLRSENASKEKLKKLVKEDKFCNAIEKNRYKIIYGIITPKDITKKSECLPLFSRISLMRIIKNYQIMNVECKVVLIKDNFDRSKPKPKKSAD